jgi:GT2 family glycosyltransferase
MKRLSIIIPTYNRKDYLARLLDQLGGQTISGVEISIVVVVDCSSDGTLEMLESKFPGAAIVNGTGHWWWTRSINEGCKFALKNGTDAVLLMNDDTEIPGNYLQTLLENARQQPGAIIGSLNLTKNSPHQIYFSGVKRIAWWKAHSARYHKLFAPYAPSLTGLHPSVLLMGRGMFIPAAVFEKTGFLDETSFPQYKSDLDFVLRANKQNIPTYISWDSIIYSHMELTGKGVTYKSQTFPAFLRSFFQENSMTNLVHSFRYYKRHCPFYLLPFSFVIDKLRLTYSFLIRRNKK